jgi:DnaJ-class molecular chaperone
MNCNICKGSGRVLGVSHKIVWLKCQLCKGTGKTNPTEGQIADAHRIRYDNNDRPLSIPEAVRYN